MTFGKKKKKKRMSYFDPFIQSDVEDLLLDLKGSVEYPFVFIISISTLNWIVGSIWNNAIKLM